VFITAKRRGDRFLSQAIGKRFIIIPPQGNLVEDSTLFLFDDVTGLGIDYPPDLVKILSKNNEPTVIYDAQELANDLAGLLPISMNLTVLDGGGVLAYLFLKKAGYEGSVRDIVKVERNYISGKPFCSLEGKFNFFPELIIDDILASGQTLITALKSCEVTSEFACLLASSNITKGEQGCRIRERSTIEGISKMYCSQFVNGPSRQGGGNMKPSILSLRYLLTKAIDNNDYSEGYLARKFGGLERAKEICSLLNEINREPIDVLRKDPWAFLRAYGEKVKK